MKRWQAVFVVVFTTILVFSSCTRPSIPTPTEKEVTPIPKENEVVEPVPETTSEPESSTKTEEIVTDNKSIPQIPAGNELIPIRGGFY